MKSKLERVEDLAASIEIMAEGEANLKHLQVIFCVLSSFLIPRYDSWLNWIQVDYKKAWDKNDFKRCKELAREIDKMPRTLESMRKQLLNSSKQILMHLLMIL